MLKYRLNIPITQSNERTRQIKKYIYNKNENLPGVMTWQSLSDPADKTAVAERGTKLRKPPVNPTTSSSFVSCR